MARGSPSRARDRSALHEPPPWSAIAFPRPVAMTPASEATTPRFLADAMLARLARWLRVLGYDTAFDAELSDPALVKRAAAEDRVLLTRDRQLVTHLSPARSLLVTADEPMEQLKQVVTACELNVSRPLFTRCLVCNMPLREATAAESETLVPESAREAGGPFLRCDGCGRTYWSGSHVRRMRDALARTFPGREL